ncbi:hypothetical protein M758_UG190200 [Ceratodon purpureus]|nr:hypothetical protein M758_UG190200 [Ceratodon purpureus]
MNLCSEPLDGSIHEILEDEDRESESWDMVLPELNMLPPLYQKAKTYHAGVHPSELDVPFLRALRDSGAEVLSVEVYMHAEEVVPYSELQALVSAGHIFSLNERELLPWLELGHLWSSLGGCLNSVLRSDTKETWDVPAFHTVFYEGRKENCDTTMTKLQKTGLEGMDVEAILDPTGCGNTFCGGFLAGWYKTRNLLTAALWESISASIMLKYEGIPPPMVSQWTAAAQQRLNFLQPHAKKIVFT